MSSPLFLAILTKYVSCFCSPCRFESRKIPHFDVFKDAEYEPLINKDRIFRGLCHFENFRGEKPAPDVTFVPTPMILRAPRRAYLASVSIGGNFLYPCRVLFAPAPGMLFPSCRLPIISRVLRSCVVHAGFPSRYQVFPRHCRLLFAPLPGIHRKTSTSAILPGNGHAQKAAEAAGHTMRPPFRRGTRKYEKSGGSPQMGFRRF